jgi:putative hydrolase of the HAD superfamily
MIKAVFFDLYGTLIDIRTDEQDLWVYAVLSHYFQYHAVRIGTEELKREYFDEIERFLRQSGEVYPEVDVSKVFCSIMHRYGKTRCPKNIIMDAAILFRSLTVKEFDTFPRLFETLKQLRGKYKMAVISDAQWVFADPEMRMLDLDRFFQQRILSSHFGYKKPDVRLFQIAMKKFRVKPEESVYIGDNLCKDLVGAKKAGMKFILFGPEFKECSPLRPDGIFSDYSELAKVISEIS